MKETNKRASERGRAIRVLLALTSVLIVAVVGFVTATALARDASQASATISLRTTDLGRILVNSRGRTLYLFAKDRNGKSSCSGQCATYWPPLLARGTTTAGPGVKRSLIHTTRRSDGKLQLTYNRHPLYMFSLDRRAGQTNGQRMSAFGAKWYAVSAAGRAVLKAPTTTPTTPTTTTTNPYPTDPYP
jgi:predicted lipoprotein with Yx(FWY)xxD motif